LTSGVEESYRANSKKPGPSDRITIEEATFSPVMSIALALTFDEFNIETLNSSALTDDPVMIRKIRRLVGKIKLKHDLIKTIRILDYVDDAVSLRYVFSDVLGVKRLTLSSVVGALIGKKGKLKEMRNAYSTDNKGSDDDGNAYIKLMIYLKQSKEFCKFVKKVLSKKQKGYTFADANFEGFEWKFNSDVIITMKRSNAGAAKRYDSRKL
ncbi:MAG: hypothetical protein V3T30_00325, partial [Thermodesulfobacteriota bacterium]